MEIKESTWRILYRGSLDSCNYDCSYCPFAKKKNTRAELLYDKESLERFTDWVSTREEQISILLTPWGEGLIRSYYQKSMVALSHFPNVSKIAIQTNLSCSLSWIDQVNKDTFALWITYHPGEVSLDKLIEKCLMLKGKGISFSVGVVGLREHFEDIELLKKALSDSYVWVNSYKKDQNYYSNAEQEWLTSMDTFFPINNKVYETKGKLCAAGNTSFSVNERGDVFPCHFIKNKLGNIYTDEIETVLAPKKCINDTCKCYIGYINLNELNLDAVYGNQLLERIPLTHK